MSDIRSTILEAKRFLKQTEQLQNEGLLDWAKQKINKGRAFLSGGDEEAINLLNKAREELVNALNIIFEHPDLKGFENKAYPSSSYLKRKFNSDINALFVNVYGNEYDPSLYEFQIPYLVRSIIKYSGKIYELEHSDDAFEELRREIIDDINSSIKNRRQLEDESMEEEDEEGYFSPSMLGSVEKKYKRAKDIKYSREIEDELNTWSEKRLTRSLDDKFDRFKSNLESEKNNALALLSKLSVTLSNLDRLFDYKIIRLGDCLDFSKVLRKNHFLFESSYSEKEYMSQEEFSKLMMNKIDTNKWYKQFAGQYKKLIELGGDIQRSAINVLKVFSDDLNDNDLQTHDDVVNYYKRIVQCYNGLTDVITILEKIRSVIFEIVNKTGTRNLLKATRINAPKLDTSSLKSPKLGFVANL